MNQSKYNIVKCSGKWTSSRTQKNFFQENIRCQRSSVSPRYSMNTHGPTSLLSLLWVYNQKKLSPNPICSGSHGHALYCRRVNSKYIFLWLFLVISFGYFPLVSSRHALGLTRSSKVWEGRVNIEKVTKTTKPCLVHNFSSQNKRIWTTFHQF